MQKRWTIEHIFIIQNINFPMEYNICNYGNFYVLKSREDKKSQLEISIFRNEG